MSTPQNEFFTVPWRIASSAGNAPVSSLALDPRYCSWFSVIGVPETQRFPDREDLKVSGRSVNAGLSVEIKTKQ